MPPLDSETARWFAAELQPHAATLRARLISQFPSARDLDDVVQEALVRVLEAHARAPVRSPKAYLFVVARNLVLMRLRRQHAHPADSLEEIEADRILDEGVDIPEATARAQEIEILIEAMQTLPTRCRQVLTLRKIYGMSQQETAAQLGIAEHTVEIHTAVGLRKMLRYFREHYDLPSAP